MTYTDYCHEVWRVMDLHPEWREGQTYFNVLAEHRPDLTDGKNPIRGSEFDPFYRDEVLPAFHLEVLTRW